jgi:diacylglycerol kinase family enzyme
VTLTAPSDPGGPHPSAAGAQEPRSPEPVPGRTRRVVALVNRGAGAVCGEDGFAEAVAALFAEGGVAAEVRLLSGAAFPEAAREAAAAAGTGAIDAVVAGGGDGSVACVAAALAGTGVALGILPLGTLNHFARDLRLKLPLKEAVAAIAGGLAGGTTRRVDMAEVNGRLFINNSSVGVYPYMVIDRDRRRRDQRLPKPVAAAIAFLRMLRRFPRRRLVISARGWSAPVATPCLFVGNNAYTTGLFELGRRERLDEGKLFIAVVKRTGALGFVALAWGLALGFLNARRRLSVLKGESAEINSRASRLTVSLDGEVAVIETPLRYRIRPGALTVIAPG